MECGVTNCDGCIDSVKRSERRALIKQRAAPMSIARHKLAALLTPTLPPTNGAAYCGFTDLGTLGAAFSQRGLLPPPQRAPMPPLEGVRGKCFIAKPGTAAAPTGPGTAHYSAACVVSKAATNMLSSLPSAFTSTSSRTMAKPCLGPNMAASSPGCSRWLSPRGRPNL